MGEMNDMRYFALQLNLLISEIEQVSIMDEEVVTKTIDEIKKLVMGKMQVCSRTVFIFVIIIVHYFDQIVTYKNLALDKNLSFGESREILKKFCEEMKICSVELKTTFLVSGMIGEVNRITLVAEEDKKNASDKKIQVLATCVKQQKA